MKFSPRPRTPVGLVALCVVSAVAFAAPADSLPSFEATSLTGQPVRAAQLLGEPTILIVTPSTDAAADTRRWAQALRERLGTEAIRVRDVLAIDLPFFMSESDALGRAREKIPSRYHDQTWLYAKPRLEKELGIPVDGANAFVLVLRADGRIVERVEGGPGDGRFERIVSAARSPK